MGKSNRYIVEIQSSNSRLDLYINDKIKIKNLSDIIKNKRNYEFLRFRGKGIDGGYSEFEINKFKCIFGNIFNIVNIKFFYISDHEFINEYIINVIGKVAGNNYYLGTVSIIDEFIDSYLVHDDELPYKVADYCDNYCIREKDCSDCPLAGINRWTKTEERP